MTRCWDGKNLDSPDHQSHMYNTVQDAFLNSGPCPASHPVRVPQVAYETLWDTTQFDKLWPADGKNPFILSNGDTKGYATHADYLFGWKGDSLQRALDKRCSGDVCSVLKTQSPEEAMKCTKPPMFKEAIDGCEPSLSSIMSVDG